MASASSALPVVEDDLARALQGQLPVVAFVQRLADQHCVSGDPSALDGFAFHVSRLSDAEVHPDRTEDLLIALVREGVLTPQQSMRLQAEHLRQLRG